MRQRCSFSLQLALTHGTPANKSFSSVYIFCVAVSLWVEFWLKRIQVLFCNQFPGRSRSTSTSHLSSFNFCLSEGFLQSPNACICKIGRQHLENHLLCCEASLKREQQPFAISQPSLLFFLAVLHCFLLEQTSYERTQMCVICAQWKPSCQACAHCVDLNKRSTADTALTRAQCELWYFVTHASSSCNC